MVIGIGRSLVVHLVLRVCALVWVLPGPSGAGLCAGFLVGVSNIESKNILTLGGPGRSRQVLEYPSIPGHPVLLGSHDHETPWRAEE